MRDKICPECKDGELYQKQNGWVCSVCGYVKPHTFQQHIYRSLRNEQKGEDKQVDYYEQRLRSKNLQNINDMNTLKQLLKDDPDPEYRRDVPALSSGKTYLNWCHYPTLSDYQLTTATVDPVTSDVIPLFYSDMEIVCGDPLNAEGERSPKVAYCPKHRKGYFAMLNRDRVRRYEEKRR
jgi:uncharacterized Zn finger protein (UPF0148 family)